MSQIVLECPHCKTILSGQSIPAAGTKLDCPQCERPFVAEPVPLAQLQAQRQAQQQQRLLAEQQQRLLAEQQRQLAMQEAQLRARAQAEAQRSDPLNQPTPSTSRPRTLKALNKRSQPHIHPAALMGLGAGAVLAIALMVMMFSGGGDESPNDDSETPASGLIAQNSSSGRSPGDIAQELPVNSTEGGFSGGSTFGGGGRFGSGSPAASQPTASSSGSELASSDSPSVNDSSTSEPANTSSSPSRGVSQFAQLPALKMVPDTLYGWRPAREYIYRVTLSKNADGKTESLSGRMMYKVNAEASQPMAGTATGTAFVVHSDGILVTCAHVVDSASTVHVTVGNERYPADVIGFDDEHDLAVLRVQATGMPSLPLADSEQVQLAEAIRVIGYPISDILGTSVKVTQGSIAGVVDQEVKLLQVDATVNPGNSGGPMLNDRGEVLGVVTSGLFGSDLAEVGFCMPANDVRNLLKKTGVPFKTGGSAAAMDGPALAKVAVPSVAFVEVTLGGGGSDATTKLLTYEGALSGGVILGALAASPYGEVLNEELESESDEVGLFSGDLAGGLFQKIPRPGVSSWEANRVTTAMVRNGENTREVPVMEQSVSAVKQDDSQVLVIERKYSVMAMADGSMVEQLPNGTATWEFDKAQKVPRLASVQLRRQRGGQTESITIRYELEPQGTSWATTLEGRTIMAVKSGIAREAFGGGATPSSPSSPRTPAPSYVTFTGLEPSQKVDLAVVTLKDVSKQYNHATCLRELATLEVIPERKDEVSEAIEAAFRYRPNAPYCIQACVVWGTKRNVDSLLTQLVTLNGVTYARDVIAALRTCGPTPDSVMTVIAFCGGLSTSRSILLNDVKLEGVKFLAAAPELSEEVALRLLKHPKDELRIAACQVLGAVGSKEALVPLRTATASNRANTALVKAAAKEAAKTIQFRIGS
ncbi:MAG: trypsin-like peptidase domain-containing protein [Planctomycetales bacterium]|nr:trypsin-like peptidase domain-containing protein [Planctomycetales bacterium]